MGARAMLVLLADTLDVERGRLGGIMDTHTQGDRAQKREAGRRSKGRELLGGLRREAEVLNRCRSK